MVRTDEWKEATSVLFDSVSLLTPPLFSCLLFKNSNAAILRAVEGCLGIDTDLALSHLFPFRCNINLPQHGTGILPDWVYQRIPLLGCATSPETWYAVPLPGASSLAGGKLGSVLLHADVRSFYLTS